MAKDNSFDVVSEVDLQEVDNAYHQAAKELVQRYDLKDSGATLEFSKGDKSFTLTAPSDFVAKQVVDVLNTKLVRRNVDLKAVAWGSPQAASGGTVRITGTLVMGIEIGSGPQDQQGHQGPEVQGQGSDRRRQAAGLRIGTRRAPERHRVPQGAGLRHPPAVHELPLAHD